MPIRPVSKRSVQPEVQARHRSPPEAVPKANARRPAPEAENDGAYKVGYGNPPLETRFKPGHKGGPGRRKGSLNQDTILRRELQKKRTVRIDGQDRRLTTLEIVNMVMIKQAQEGKDRAMARVFDEANRLFAAPEAKSTAPSEDLLAADRMIVEQISSILALGQPMLDQDSGDPKAVDVVDEPDDDDFWNDEEDQPG